MDNQEEQNLAEVRLQQCIWSPRLEVDGVAIHWNASVKEFQRGHSTYVVESLEQPLLLPKDMDVVKKLKPIPKKGSCYGKFTATHFLFIKF